MLQGLSCTGFFVLAVSLLSLAARAQSSPRDRAAALRTLKGCATRPITLGCSEETAAYLIGLHDRGDHNLLKPLLDAGVSSDGALAEILGDFYSNVLSKNPRAFSGVGPFATVQTAMPSLLDGRRNRRQRHAKRYTSGCTEISAPHIIPSS